MGWYSAPFNYDGTSPTQVRDDLQKANENFQALSDVFENGTPLSGRIKSSYLPGGGGVSGDIVVSSVTISNPNKVNFGIDLSKDSAGFYQAAIKMPAGLGDSVIQWQPASGEWGSDDSRLGVSSDGRFIVVGRHDSSGRRLVYLYDDVNVKGQITSASIRLAPQANQNSLIDLRSNAVDCSGAYILMPAGGVLGNFISWGNPASDNTLIGVIPSLGDTLVIYGKPVSDISSPKYKRRQVGIWDDVSIHGNLSVDGTITGNFNFVIPDVISVKKVNIYADNNQDVGINLRNSANFSSAAILMPSTGSGNYISWDPDGKSSGDFGGVVGRQSDNGYFVIYGLWPWSNGNYDKTGRRTVYMYDDVYIPQGGLTISGGNLRVNGIYIGYDSSDQRAKIIGLPFSLNQNRNSLFVYSDLSVVGYSWFNGHINIVASGDSYGITFRATGDTSNFTEGAVLMPRYGNNNYISWNPYSTQYKYGLIGRQQETGHFVIYGLPQVDANKNYVLGSEAEVYIYTNVFMPDGSLTIGDNLTVGGAINTGSLTVSGSATVGSLTVANSFYTAVGTIKVYPQNNTTEGGEIELLGAGSYGTAIVDNNFGRLRLWTASGSNTFVGVVVDPSGNVGIGGDFAPSYKLHVLGNIAIQAGANAFVGTVDNYRLSLRTNNTDRVVIDTNGNVGIGTTSPQVTLHVKSSGMAGVQVDAPNGQQCGYKWVKDGAIKWSAYIDANSSDLRFWDGTDNRVIFASGGNVTISNNLTVGGAINTGSLAIGGGATVGNNLTVGGVINVGSISVSGSATVGGNFTVSGVITQGSDLSMKGNIVLFSDSALALVRSIDVYKYLLKESKEEHVGFIANYVRDIFPHGVTVDGNGVCSINILDMLALLFKAVKELAEHVANN